MPRVAHLLRLCVAACLLLACLPARADPITITVALIEIGASSAVAATIASVVSFVASYGAVLATVGTMWYGQYQRRKAAAEARRKWLQSLEDRYVMATLTNGARQRVYGRCRTGSDIIFKRAWGADSEVYTLLISVAGHQVHAIPEVYIGDKRVTLDGDGWVQDDPWKRSQQKRSATADVVLDGSGAGSVTLPHSPLAGSISVVQVGVGESDTVAHTVSGSTVTITGGLPGGAKVFYQYNPGTSYCRIRRYLGGPSQDLYSALVGDFPELEPTDRFAGDAMLRVDMYYSTEAWAGGIQPITAVVEGLALYDPRTGTTAYTENLALFARDWSLYEFGGGLAEQDLVQPSFTASANACDITHTFTVTAADGTTTEVEDKLYRGGIVCRLEGNPEAYLAEMCEGMAGRYGWSGGRLMVVAGVWRSPVLDIDETWFSDQGGEFTIAPEPALDDAVNSMRLSIADEANSYIVTELDPLIAEDYVTADGRELVQSLEMQAPQTAYHAQHVGGVLMREARQGLAFAAFLKPIGLQLELFDVVRIRVAEFGWALKAFEVQSFGFTPRGAIAVSFKETAASIYDPAAGFSDLGWSDNTNLPQPSAAPLVEGLSAESGTADLVDGSVLTRTRVYWDPVGVAAVTQGGNIEVQYIEATGTTDLESAWSSVVEPGAATETIIPGLRTDRVYLFRARARTPLARGEWCVQLGYRIGSPPAASITAELTRPSATVAAAADGTVASFAGAGGTLQMRRNGLLLDAAELTFVVAAESGVDMAIDAAGAYSVSSMSADTGTATLRAVYDGVPFDRGYTIAKARAGADAVVPDVPTSLPSGSAVSAVSSGTAVAGVQVKRNGDIMRRIGSTYSLIGRWYTGTATNPGDTHELRLSFVAGTVGTGAGSGLALSSDREASISKGSPDGEVTSTVLIEIFATGDSTPLGTGTCYLRAQYETAGP